MNHPGDSVFFIDSSIGTQEIEGTWQEYLILCRCNGIHGDDRSYRIVPGFMSCQMGKVGRGFVCAKQ